MNCAGRDGSRAGGRHAERPCWNWVSYRHPAPRAVVDLSQYGIDVVAVRPEHLHDIDAPTIAPGGQAVLEAMLIERRTDRPAPLVFIGPVASDARALLIERGADDALSDAVSARELAARMVRLLDRYEWRDGFVSIGSLAFDTGLKQLKVDGRRLPLMPREFDLLLYLARKVGEPVSRLALWRDVWRLDFDPGTNSLEVHLCRLRRKLAADGGAPRIETIKGYGYRLELCDPARTAWGRFDVPIQARPGGAGQPLSRSDSGRGVDIAIRGR